MTTQSSNPSDGHGRRMSGLTLVQRQAFARTDRWLKAIRTAIVKPVLTQRPVLDRVEEWLQTDGKALLTIVAEFHRLWADSLPPAWRSLEPGEIADLFRLTSEGTLCLVWAPRTDILRELIDTADFPGREAVLIARREDILDDIELALADASVGADEDDAKRFAVAALIAARHDQDLAAQALCGVALARVVHGVLDMPTLAKAREEMSALDPKEAALSSFARY